MKKFVAYQIENVKLLKRLLAIALLSAASATYLVDSVLAASLNSVSTYNSADSNAFETIQLRTTRTLPAQVVPSQLLAQVGLPTPKFTEIASVTSGPNPSSGQRNRSSGNFSIENLPANSTGLYWVVLDTSGLNVNSNIVFNVKIDRSAASDPTPFSNLANGSTTPITTGRSFYIANPRGANSQNFIVKVYAVYF